MRRDSLLLVTLLASGGWLSAQTPNVAPTTPREAVSVLKRFYFAYDFAGGDSAGIALSKRFPKDPEVRAWHVLNLTRTGAELDGLRAAESLARQQPTSQWSTFAKAFALSYQSDGEDESLKLAAGLYRKTPSNPDIIWLHGQMLQEARKYDEVVALVDSVQKRMRPWGALLVLKANAFATNSMSPTSDTALRARARAVFAEARRVEPTHVTAHYFQVANLPADSSSPQLLRRAIELSPVAHGLHVSYWRQVRARRDLSAAQKDSIIGADIDQLLARRPHMPNILLAAAREYGTMKQFDKLYAMQERILREHQDAVHVESVIAERIRALWDTVYRVEGADTARAAAMARRLTRNFMSRPVHRSGVHYTNMVLDYYQLIREDSTVSVDSLRRFGEILIKHNRMNTHWTHDDLPLRIAERKGDFRWAEKLVRAGDTLRKRSVEQRRAMLVQMEGVGGYADRLDSEKAMTHDALGWVFFNEGRLDDAQRELDKARELNRTHPRIYFHLGRLAEARGHAPEAQAMFGKGYALESSFTGRQNADALKRMYLANKGTMDGFETYVEAIKEEDRQRRKQKIVDSRLGDGDTIPAFSLARYGDNGGPKVTKADLKGKIAVINFWGVWCGPCVKEIPQIQKFHENMKNDTSVVFLTVDYNDTPEMLDEFMKKRKLDFPVVFDANRWVMDQAKISSYPTTWFVDRDGKLVFKHSGASDVVLEEFLWRIESLKSGARPLKP